MLLASADDAKAAVEDSEVRVKAHSNSEIEFPVIRMAIEPVAIVNVSVAGGGNCHGLGSLVDGVVIKAGEHGGSSRFVGRFVAKALCHGRGGSIDEVEARLAGPISRVAIFSSSEGFCGGAPEVIDHWFRLKAATDPREGSVAILDRPGQGRPRCRCLR